jgi:phosphoribosylformylglycinamidine cyclo-ligase
MTTSEKPVSRYSGAGVDIDKGNAFVSRIKNLVKATHGPQVLDDIGGFSGLFSLGGNALHEPVLVASTDGVGTKLKIAQLCGKHDTIGIDLVAMCVNDVIVCGAKPLFFLDYFACSSLDLEAAENVIKGIAAGCKQAGCALIGGETAEMPGMYQPGDYDLAGFTVGICERAAIIDKNSIQPGDKIIGLASSGLHSNGYSLVRKIVFEELGLHVSDQVPELGCTLGEELLKPTRIYVAPVLQALARCKIRGLVHITGGGFFDNIPRVLPSGCKAVIDKGSWEVPKIFSFLQEKGSVAEAEMFRTFNMGIGMMVVVASADAEPLMEQFRAAGETPFLLGEMQTAEAGEAQVLINGLNSCD